MQAYINISKNKENISHPIKDYLIIKNITKFWFFFRFCTHCLQCVSTVYWKEKFTLTKYQNRSKHKLQWWSFCNVILSLWWMIDKYFYSIFNNRITFRWIADNFLESNKIWWYIHVSDDCPLSLSLIITRDHAINKSSLKLHGRRKISIA